MGSGQFGFQKEMHALDSLLDGDTAGHGENVAALLHCTHEVENRVKEIYRWWKLWRADVRAGWALFARFRVSAPRFVLP